MPHIVIIGGHGKVAMRLARLLSARGDIVTSVIRNEDHAPEVAATGARPVVLDVEHADLDHIKEVLVGKDAVVWSAGAGGGNPSRTYSVDRDAAIRTMEATAKASLRRFVMVSYLGAGPGHGVAEDHPFHAYAEAKAAADQHLRGSGLDWTILGPGALVDEPGTGRIEVRSGPEPTGEDAGEGSSDGSTDVPRDDVAAAVVATLDDATTVHRTIDFVGGDVPIVEALRGSAR